jgi:hypothetical protein
MVTVITYRKFAVDENGDRRYELYRNTYYPVDYEDFTRVINIIQDNPLEYELVFAKQKEI